MTISDDRSATDRILDEGVRLFAARGFDGVSMTDLANAAQVSKANIFHHFANKDELGGEFIRTSREGFRLAHDVSAYSLVALAREARPLMSDGGAILTLSYYGAEKAVINYNVMGVAKASLEACVRYLAVDLGKEGIRVNAISAGPVRTLAASGVTGFKKMHRLFNEIAPLRRPLSIDDLGNAAAYLCSDMSRGTTGEIHYVDGGYNIIGVPEVLD